MSDGRDDLSYRQRVFLRKLEISFVMSRHTHYGSRAVFSQDVVCDPHRNVFAAEWVDRDNPGVNPFLLFFGQLTSIAPAFRNLIGKSIHISLQVRTGE